MSQRPRIRCKKGATLAERIALHSVTAPSGCVIWTGARNAAGHGRIRVDDKTLYAHRVNYEMVVGPIPSGLELDHLCRRPACIRVQHLQPVTPQVNVLRGTSPGARAQRRDICLSGHPYAEHGVVRGGRRVCRICRIEYRRAWDRRQRDLVPAERAASFAARDPRSAAA